MTEVHDCWKGSGITMKLECNRSALATAFGAVGAVIPSRTPKPILQNAKLEVAGGKTTLIGTDSEIAIRYEVPDVECKGSAEALLPTKRVNDILRELRDERVTLHLEQDAVRLCGERSEFRLPVSDPAEYPPVAGFDDQDYFTIPGKTLRDMIRRTLFATDPESARYALGGILFEFSDERLSLVATDSRRLALMHAPCSRHGAVLPPASPPVIPSKTMSLLERTIPDTDDLVQIAIHHPNDVLFKTANATIFSRLVEGRFPRYQDVIPRSHSVSIDLIAGTFHSVVRQAMIVTNEESRGVDFSFSDGSVVLVSQAADVGTSRIELPISYSGEELVIRFDPRFISDFLKVLPAEMQVSLKLSTDEDPGVLTTEDGYTYVIMPLAREG